MHIPQLHFRSEVTFQALQTLEKIQVPPSLNAIYTPRYKYVRRLVKDDIATIENLFLNIPPVRESALNLIGLMCHECINITFLKRENQQTDSQAVHLEVHLIRFFEHLPTILTRFDSKKLGFTLLKWLLSLCNEISQRNQERTTVKLARDLAPYFMKIRCIESIVKLLDFVLSSLMPECVDNVVGIVVDCFNYGQSFDWILLHLVTSFSSDFVPPLLDICIRETAKRNEAFLQSREPQKAEQISFISDLFVYLSIKKTPKLRSVLVEHLTSFFNEKSSMNPIFCIANLLFVHPSLAELIKDEIQHLITNANLIVFISLVFKTQWVITQHHPTTLKPLNVAQSVVKILRILPLDTLLNIYDKMVPLISNPLYLNQFTKLDESSFVAARLKLEQFMNDLFTTILMKTLDTNDLSFSTVPYLNDIGKNETKCEALMKDVLEGNDRARYNSKLLSLCCVVGQKHYTSQIVGQLLYNAKSEKELKNVIAFARTIKSSYPHILSDSASYLLEHFNEFDTKFHEENPGTLANFNFLKNLATIFEWQIGDLKDEINISLGINFFILDGHLQMVFLNNLIEVLERFVVAENQKEHNIVDLVYEWIGYMGRFKLFDVNRLNANVLSSLVKKLATVGLLLIRYLPGAADNEKEIVELCKSYFNYCQLFMCKGPLKQGGEQNLQIVRWFLLHFIEVFLQNVFDMSHNLFGTKPGLLESSEQMAFDEVSSCFLPQIFQSTYIPDSSQDCLQQLRNKPFIQRRTAELAHSGRISNQHSKFKQKTWTSIEKLRCSIIVGFCTDFCTIYKQRLPKIKEAFWCSVGKTLVSATCPDSLTSTVSWLDWSIEKECVSFYTEITNKIRDLPLIYDLLVQLAKTGFVSTCSALPLIKSMFAVVVNFHGATPRKSDKLSVTQLEDIARLLSLFFSSGILPLQYKPMFEIFKTTTHHETYLILSSLWEYIRLKVPQSIVELNALCNGEIPQTEFMGRENPRFLTAIITPIVQVHIEDLGYLLPGLLTDEETENCENEVW